MQQIQGTFNNGEEDFIYHNDFLAVDFCFISDNGAATFCI